MSIKVLAIAPYQGLKNIIEQVGANEQAFDLHVEYGNLNEGLEAARAAENDGYEMILSRGGTAKLIREQVSLPVIDIQVTGYDVLRVLTLAKDYTGRVAILGFPSIANGAETICNLLQIDISVYKIDDETEVEPKINEIKKLGYDVIIGDVVTVQTARKLGLQEILITSGTESVREAFDDMKEIHQFLFRQKQHQQLFIHALDDAEQGIFILNNNGRAVYSNETASQLISDGFLENPAVKTFLHQLNNESKSVLHIDGMLYPVSGRMLQMAGHTYSVLYVNRPPKSLVNEHGMTIIDPSPHVDPSPFSRVTGTSQVIRQAVEKAKKCSRSDIPIWLSGEKETGKELFAHLIHQASSRNVQPLLQLDAEQISATVWEEILSDQYQLPASHFGTVYVQNFDKLDLPIRKRLVSFFKSPRKDEPRWIVSSEKGLNDLWTDEYFLDYSGEAAEGHIHLPPLRERVDDLEDLSRIFIAHFNSVFGKEIVGFDPAVYHELKSLLWPGNISQLKQAVGRFVLESSGPYVQLYEAESTIADIRKSEQDLGNAEIDLSGTLDEIEKQVIKKVLHDENMNQSKAAKRLGINRTTLWRKLK